MAADAHLVELVRQAQADVAPAQTPQEATPTPTPSVSEAPAVAPVEAAQAAEAPPAPASVFTLDLSKLTAEQRKDYEDAVAKEGDPVKVFSRYWEFNRRLGKNGDASQQATQPAATEVAPAQSVYEPTAAPPREVVATEVRNRLLTDPEVSQWRSTYGENKATLGELLKIDPALPKPEFDASLDAQYRNLSFEIQRLTRNLGDQYVKENPDVELGIRQTLADLKGVRMEIDRARMQNDYLDSRYAEKRKAFEQTVSDVKRQEYEASQAVVRQEKQIEEYAERFDRAWGVQLATTKRTNQIEDEIAGGFDRMAKYEVLGMISRGEITDYDSQLSQVLDKLAKQYQEEIDLGHRYISRKHALRAKENAEAPIIVPPNSVAPQDTNKPPMTERELDETTDALLRRTLGEMALR
jgi:hypothetical protein